MAEPQDVRRRKAVAIFIGLALAGVTTALSACNTIAGAGQDISATGNALSGGAEKTKQALPPTP